MILEIMITSFYFVLALLTCFFYRKTNKSHEYLIRNFSKDILIEYIHSYIYDKKVTKKLRTKKQLVQFIIRTTELIHNVRECNICYETTDYIRVHKCKICTMMICMNCLNRFTIPVKCPQCSFIFYFQDITNNVLHLIYYDEWYLFVLTCSTIVLFVLFFFYVLCFFSYIKK